MQSPYEAERLFEAEITRHDQFDVGVYCCGEGKPAAAEGFSLRAWFGARWFGKPGRWRGAVATEEPSSIPHDLLGRDRASEYI